ncbi:unnamed protein product [Polarella glacialis]|uniref:RING-type domain-containing protein n=1 Tax=Polarella glacialis TaxID=89957 RepID=A0A813HA54_POLGL|nr:unnamed protein product [Polarella glacialis]
MIEDFQHECLLAAQECKTECKAYLVWPHGGRFTYRWYRDPKIQDEVAVCCEHKLQATFGPNSQTSVSLRGRTGSQRFSHGIELAATWPLPTPRADQRSSSHAPRSNLNSQCPVCLCRAEVVALTPCGHVLCVSCSANFHRGSTCPVCHEPVAGRQNLFS